MTRPATSGATSLDSSGLKVPVAEKDAGTLRVTACAAVTVICVTGFCAAATDGCVFEAVLPSDPMSLEGDLTVSVRRQGAGTEVAAATKIAGQMFDWGKSRRCLDVFFADLQLDAA